MSVNLFKGSFSNPFQKRIRSDDPEDSFWTNRKIRVVIRFFAAVFILFVSAMTVYRLTNKPLNFEQKLASKEAVYLPIKQPPFRAADPASDEVIVPNPGEKERLYQTQIYSIGNLRYRAAIVYWDRSDIPKGTTYKQVSPLGAIKELIENDLYDGVVFILGAEQEYYGRSTFDDLILKLKLKQPPSVRIMESKQ